MMEQGRQYNLNTLLNEYRILIPQIQRDYVQGRKDEKIEINREKFVKSLIGSICDSKELMLNFVYGYQVWNDNKVCFVPIDGQQRLTTLFLLEIYLRARQGKDVQVLRQNFKYETRFTTDRFFDKLLIEENFARFAEMVKKNEAIGGKIREESWYSVGWDNDPTIVSCLIMLDEIHNAFVPLAQNFDDYTTDKITFMLLEIEGLGRPNDLYIKMNARGKQLTDFENMKAELYGCLDDFMGDEEVKNFKSRMDGIWLEFIWRWFRDNDGISIAENYADVLYKDLLHWVFYNRLTLAGGDVAKLGEKKISNCTLDEYKNCHINENTIIDKDSFKACLEDLRDVLNLFYSLQEKREKDFVDSIFKDFVDSIFKTIFGEIKNKEYISHQLDYPTHVLLFAMTKCGAELAKLTYLSEEEKIRIACDWWRIAKNIITNTEFNNFGEYKTSCEGINKKIGVVIQDLSVRKIDALNGVGISNLRPWKVEEEIEKYRLLQCGYHWRNTILDAEKMQYFNGEIGFLLVLSRREDGSYSYDLFKKRADKIQSIFEYDFADLLRRVLLTFEDGEIADYSDKANDIYLFFGEDKHHNHDWRGYLRPNENGEIASKGKTPCKPF